MLLEAKVDEYKEMAKMSTSTDLVTLKELLKFMLTVVDPKETTMATTDTFVEKIKSEVCNDLVYLHKAVLLNYQKFYWTPNQRQRQYGSFLTASTL